MTATPDAVGTRLGELLLEPERVQPVGGDPGHRHVGDDPLERRAQPAAAPPDVVVVHRLAEHM